MGRLKARFFRKSAKLLLVAIVVVFASIGLSACGGGGSGSGGDSSAGSGTIVSGSGNYSLGSGNHALMGPLKNASIKIYRLSDTSTAIIDATTNGLGAFNISLPADIPNGEILLVTATGGEDIDANDDGILDKVPTTNDGTIRALATAGDLKSGKVNVTLASEIVYQYSKQLINDIKTKSLSASDFTNILNLISARLTKVKKDKITEAYKDLLAFRPMNASDRKMLTFSYDDLIKGENSLSYLYHNNSKDSLKKLEELFYAKGLVLNDPRWLHAKEQVRVTVVGAPYDTVWFGDKANTSSSMVYSFFKKGSKVVAQVGNIDPEYKILRWHGCDEISDDLRTCTIDSIQTDTTISPVVVPAKNIFKKGLTIVDITGAYVDTSSAKDKLSNITVFADLDNSVLKSKLAAVKAGDVIVNKKTPVFFRKVVTITKINDVRYQLTTETIPLEDIIPRGYISTSPTVSGAGGTSAAKGVRAISSFLRLPNGREIPFDPNNPEPITIKFGNGKAKIYRGLFSISKKYSPSLGTIVLDPNTSITGTLTFTPHLDFDMSWGWSWKNGLDYLYLSPGMKVNSDLTFSASKEETFGVGPKTLFNIGTLVEQIGIVELTEQLPLVYGIRGIGVGTANDESSIGGKLGVEIKTGIDPTEVITYNGGNVSVNQSFSPYISIIPNISASAKAFAYVGIDPSLTIYGFGLRMSNDIGPYLSLEGNASGNVSARDISTSVSASLTGEIGLGYYGKIAPHTDWSLLQDFVAKLTDKIGASKDIWKAFPFNTFSASAKTSVEPANITVEGPSSKTFVKKWSDILDETVSYTIKNTGGSNGYWRIKPLTIGHIKTTLSESSGMLKPGISKTIEVTFASYYLPEKGGNFPVTLSFLQEPDASEASGGWTLRDKLPSYIFNSLISIKVLPKVDETLSSPLSVKIVGKTVRNLNFTWTPVDSPDVNGYTLYYSTYDGSTSTCSTAYNKFASIYENTTSSDNEPLDSLKPGDYCFTLYAYKTKAGTGEKFYFPLHSTPVVFSIPATASGTSKTIDIVLLVDMSGSYEDDLSTFQTKSNDIVNKLKSALPKDMTLKIGLASFDDYPSWTGDSNDYPFKLELNLTNDTSAFTSAINNDLSVKYGGDTPEAQLEGLSRTVEQMKWDTSATKLILLFTDASFHDKDKYPLDASYPGRGSVAAKKLLEENNIAVIGMGSGVISQDMKDISDYTYLLSSDSSGVVKTIADLISMIPGSEIITTRASTRSSKGVSEPYRVLLKSVYSGEPN